MAHMTLPTIPGDMSCNCSNQSSHVLARLTASEHRDQVDAQELLELIQRRHKQLGPIDLSETTLTEMRNAGRP